MPHSQNSPTRAAARATTKRQRGFTLIELLIVIAIVGLFTGISIASFNTVRTRAQRVVDSSNLRQIITAALAYAADNNERLPNPDSPGLLSAPAGVYLWPGLLARAGALDEPAMYSSALDSAAAGELPASVLDPQDRNTLNAAFASGRELSWEFVGGLRTGDPASTPVAFTRGLLPSGTWDRDNGVYGDSGGYVVFLGGNVVFFNSASSGKFINTQTGQATDNLLEALPRRPGIKIWATTRGGIGSPGGTDAPSS